LEPTKAADFLRDYVSNGMMVPGDCMIIGLDRCQDVSKVKLAYSEKSAEWQKYIRNAMSSAGRILGGDAAQAMAAEDQWDYVSRWDSQESRHMVCAKC
jgi:uncharacterized SAM-dependent methyltransferase